MAQHLVMTAWMVPALTTKCRYFIDVPALQRVCFVAQICSTGPAWHLGTIHASGLYSTVMSNPSAGAWSVAWKLFRGDLS